MSSFVYIHNLDEAAAWTASGSDAFAKPRLAFSVSDPDGDDIVEMILKIYTAASGGSPAYTADLTGAALATALANGYYDCDYVMPNKTQASSERWATIEAVDSYGGTSGESARVAFKVCWGQAIYEYTPGAGTSGWGHSHNAVGSESVAFLYRYADGPASGSPSVGSWKKSISDVVPNTYVNVLVRLATQTAGTNMLLADMTFTSAGGAQQPDHWTVDGNHEWSLDNSRYRFGSKALHCVIQDDLNDAYAYPFRVADGDGVPVITGTEYTWSFYVYCPTITSPSVIRPRLRRYVGAGNYLDIYPQSDLDGGIYSVIAETVTDPAAQDGWVRLHAHFIMPLATSVVEPMIFYDNGGSGSGDEFWIDAGRFEEGRIASSWDGVVSQAVLLDPYGVTIDGSKGAQLRLMNTAGTTSVDLDQIVTAVTSGGGGGASNLDGGDPTTNYGGTTAVDGGAP